MSPAFLAVVLAAAPVRMAFELPQGWVLTDATGKLLERVTAYDGRRPIDLALSPTSSEVVFTASRPGALAGLFVWDGASVKDLSVDPGYHGFPTFSPDGRSIAFVHHPGAGSGPAGQHALGQNAQAWRVDADGKNAAQLTSSRGCKASPHFAAPSKLLFTHNTCRGPQGLEELALTPGAEPRQVIPPDGIFAEPSLSPNRKALLYTQGFHSDTRLVWATVGSPTEGHVLATVTGRPRRVSARWSIDGKAVFFVKDGAVHHAELSTPTDTVVLELPPEPR